MQTHAWVHNPHLAYMRYAYLLKFIKRRKLSIKEMAGMERTTSTPYSIYMRHIDQYCTNSIGNSKFNTIWNCALRRNMKRTEENKGSNRQTRSQTHTRKHGYACNKLLNLSTRSKWRNMLCNNAKHAGKAARGRERERVELNNSTSCGGFTILQPVKWLRRCMRVSEIPICKSRLYSLPFAFTHTQTNTPHHCVAGT